MLFKIFYLTYLAIFQFNVQALTISQQEIVKSISDELISKQIIIVKNLSEESNIYKLGKMVKHFSKIRIYTSFISVNEMELLFQKLVLDLYNLGEYYPRTMAIIDSDNFAEMMESYFHVSFDNFFRKKFKK